MESRDWRAVAWWLGYTALGIEVCCVLQLVLGLYGVRHSTYWGTGLGAVCVFGGYVAGMVSAGRVYGEEDE